MTKIIVQVYNVLDEFINDIVFQELKENKLIIAEKYKDGAESFKIKRERYEAIMSQGGQYHPDYKETIKELSEAKAILYQKEEVKKYLELEKRLQDNLDDFLIQITKTVSVFIKPKSKFGVINKGGNCNECK